MLFSFTNQLHLSPSLILKSVTDKDDQGHKNDAVYQNFIKHICIPLEELRNKHTTASILAYDQAVKIFKDLISTLPSTDIMDKPLANDSAAVQEWQEAFHIYVETLELNLVKLTENLSLFNNINIRGFNKKENNSLKEVILEYFAWLKVKEDYIKNKATHLNNDTKKGRDYLQRIAKISAKIACLSQYQNLIFSKTDIKNFLQSNDKLIDAIVADMLIALTENTEVIARVIAEANQYNLYYLYTPQLNLIEKDLAGIFLPMKLTGSQELLQKMQNHFKKIDTDFAAMQASHLKFLEKMTDHKDQEAYISLKTNFIFGAMTVLMSQLKLFINYDYVIESVTVCEKLAGFNEEFIAEKSTQIFKKFITYFDAMQEVLNDCVDKNILFIINPHDYPQLAILLNHIISVLYCYATQALLQSNKTKEINNNIKTLTDILKKIVSYVAVSESYVNNQLSSFLSMMNYLDRYNIFYDDSNKDANGNEITNKLKQENLESNIIQLFQQFTIEASESFNQVNTVPPVQVDILQWIWHITKDTLMSSDDFKDHKSMLAKIHIIAFYILKNMSADLIPTKEQELSVKKYLELAIKEFEFKENFFQYSELDLHLLLQLARQECYQDYSNQENYMSSLKIAYVHIDNFYNLTVSKYSKIERYNHKKDFSLDVVSDRKFTLMSLLYLTSGLLKLNFSDNSQLASTYIQRLIHICKVTAMLAADYSFTFNEHIYLLLSTLNQRVVEDVRSLIEKLSIMVDYAEAIYNSSFAKTPSKGANKKKALAKIQAKISREECLPQLFYAGFLEDVKRLFGNSNLDLNSVHEILINLKNFLILIGELLEIYKDIYPGKHLMVFGEILQKNYEVLSKLFFENAADKILKSNQSLVVQTILRIELMCEEFASVVLNAASKSSRSGKTAVSKKNAKNKTQNNHKACQPGTLAKSNINDLNASVDSESAKNSSHENSTQGRQGAGNNNTNILLESNNTDFHNENIIPVVAKKVSSNKKHKKKPNIAKTNVTKINEKKLANNIPSKTDATLPNTGKNPAKNAGSHHPQGNKSTDIAAENVRPTCEIDFIKPENFHATYYPIRSQHGYGNMTFMPGDITDNYRKISFEQMGDYHYMFAIHTNIFPAYIINKVEKARILFQGGLIVRFAIKILDQTHVKKSLNQYVSHQFDYDVAFPRTNMLDDNIIFDRKTEQLRVIVPYCMPDFIQLTNSSSTAIQTVAVVKIYLFGVVADIFYNKNNDEAIEKEYSAYLKSLAKRETQRYCEEWQRYRQILLARLQNPQPPTRFANNQFTLFKNNSNMESSKDSNDSQNDAQVKLGITYD
ncbi:MAG: hypothetical protein Tsb005_15090 [Gammaproteobacteria bacterium]